MKFSKLIALYIWMSVYLVSCNYKSTDISSTIQTKSDSLLFLSFWPDMSKEEFKQVCQIEEKNGRLKQGEFPILYPNNTENLFKISCFEKSIMLEFEKLNYLPGDTKRFDMFHSDGTYQAERYRDFKDYLIKLFDDKYNLIKKEGLPYEGNIEWNDSVRIISLGYSISYKDSYTVGLYMDKEKSDSKFLSSKKRIVTSSVSMRITYQFRQDYLNRKLREQQIIKEQAIEIDKRNQDIQSKVDLNRNLL